MKNKWSKLLMAAMGIFGFILVGNAQDDPNNKEALEGTKLTARGILKSGKMKTITLLDDRFQDYMTTKVYEIKNMKAVDLRPFVEGAVRRADGQSGVARLNYKHGKEQFLSVSMPNWMVPYIDDMVEKLDRGGIKGPNGSTIAGDGIHRFYYKPNYRSTEAMRALIFDRYEGGDDIQFRDPASNLFYWKGSASDGKDVGKWLKAIDRPLPQMTVKLNIYQVTEDSMRELGIDYVAWKNGPGMNLFGSGLDYLDFASFDDVSDFTNMLDITSYASGTFPGMFIAPNIDATFLRLLAQKGKSRVATSPVLTIINAQDTTDSFNFRDNATAFANARFRVRFQPNFQAVTKQNANVDNQELVVGTTAPDVQFYLVNPTIGHNNTSDPTEGAILKTGWVVNIDTYNSEMSNSGQTVDNDYNFLSETTIKANSEKLLASYVKEHKANQNNGIIGLSDIPVLKYLFGATSDSTTLTRYFVTMSAERITPETSLSPWAQQVVTADDMLNKHADSDEQAQLPGKNSPVQTPLTEQFNYK